jgi:ribosomal protein S27AE
MLKGRCPKCGASYYGWALRFPRHQSCPTCGVGLIIIENGQVISEGYSPFTAEKYHIPLPPEAPKEEKKKGRRAQKE